MTAALQEKSVPNKGLITASVMLATIMQALDTTIANVALPRIQANLSATHDEAAWVLTSYIIAAAVMFPLTGWLANRFGRRPVFLISIIVFIVASALCGAAASLDQLVAFRMLQGVGGAALVPLSQAILFEINDPKDYGRAMSLWGMAAMMPPAFGPVLGGWLTDNFNWRWIFYINVPVGILAFLGLLAALPHTRNTIARRFDILGFAALSLAIASFQLMLDRGQLLDWFSSREIVIEAIIAGTAFYVFLVHILSTPHPFVNPALFKDRNYVGAVIFLFLFGVVLFASMALLPPLLQTRFNYPVITTGVVMAPRGIGMILGMFIVGRLVPRYDARIVMAIGMALSVYSLWQMTQFSLQMDSWPVMVAGLAQGLGVGAVNVCLSVLAFVTLPSNLRNEGTSISNLIRSTGGAIGISVTVFLLTQNTQRMHASLGEHITPYTMHNSAAAAHLGAQTTQSLMALNHAITAQGQMVAYLDDFRLMMILTILTLPFLLIFRRTKP